LDTEFCRGRKEELLLAVSRAAMSLSGLWQQQGKRQEAHALLAPIYGWFTEGFDTVDLREAKTLFDELTRRSVGHSSLEVQPCTARWTCGSGWAGG
jgi:predicted ATPase